MEEVASPLRGSAWRLCARRKAKKSHGMENKKEVDYISKILMQNIMLKPKYFLYARKSTEDDDKQMMSIEAQLFELREYAHRENLEILAEFTEAKSAKTPEREKFTEMIDEIEKSEGVGILAWHPDRLARNSVDGGRIIYLVDTGKIVSLRFPTFWFEPTPQGKFMLQVAFGQSKYYSDNLGGKCEAWYPPKTPPRRMAHARTLWLCEQSENATD